MQLTVLLGKTALPLAICWIALSTPPAWCGQSTPAQPPQKDTSGSQAGSPGKDPSQMGSKSGDESEMRVGKDESKTEQKKTDKKKKAAKTEKAPAKTTSSQDKN